MSFGSKNFESLDTLNLFVDYEKEYEALKDQSPEDAKKYLIGKTEAVDMHLKNEVLDEKLKQFNQHELKTLYEKLSNLAIKEGIMVA